MKKILLFTFFHSFLVILASAQNFRIELHLKAAGLLVKEWSPAHSASASYISPPSVEIYYFVKPKIAIGVFYVNSLNYNTGEENSGPMLNTGSYHPSSDDYPDAVPHYQHYGAAIQYSTPRDRRFRFIATIGVLKGEQWLNFLEFRTGKSALGYVGGIGTALKVTRSIGFNVFNAKFIYYKKDFAYFEESFTCGLMVDSGFIIKFLREK